VGDLPPKGKINQFEKRAQEFILKFEIALDDSIITN
jgi:hypothetical protein